MGRPALLQLTTSYEVIVLIQYFPQSHVVQLSVQPVFLNTSPSFSGHMLEDHKNNEVSNRV